MEILLVRHAIAEDPRSGQPDAERELTERGIERFEEVALGLAELGLLPDEIATSPLTRAIRTAEILSSHAEVDVAVWSELGTQPDGHLLTRLAASATREPERLALVGHQPWLGQLAVRLAGLGGFGLALRKGGIVQLDGSPQPGGMRLEALMGPKLLRRLS